MMTIQLRQARAIQRAFDTPAHVMALRDRPGFYQVRSRTNPKDRHIVVVHDGVIECGCDAGVNTVPCWHTAKVANRLIREAHRKGSAKYGQ